MKNEFLFIRLLKQLPIWLHRENNFFKHDFDYTCMHVKLLQSCPTLQSYRSPSGSYVHGISQVRTLEGVAMPSLLQEIFLPQGSKSNPSLWHLLHGGGGSFTTSATWEAHFDYTSIVKYILRPKRAAKNLLSLTALILNSSIHTT